jgi:nitrate reductase NapE component
MSELGLFSILPVSFFVAFGLLVLAFFITLITGSQNRS